MKSRLVAGLAVLTMFVTSGLQAQSPARITQPINNNVIRVPHSTHPLANAANDLGRADANLPMERMTLVLTPSEEQRAAMLKLINDQHNPDSPSYHQWLAPEEFGAKFGPSDEDVAKISSWLQQQGFRVNAVGRGKHFIEFSGTARQVENAFQTEMHHYMVNGEDHIANARDISLPRALTPVVGGVLSLHNFQKGASRSKSFKVHRDATTGKLVPDFTLSTSFGSAHFTAPGDFARIYNTEPLLAQHITGAGVSIAVIGRSNINLSDVQTFRKIFGLPAKDPIFVINGQDPGLNGDEEEADLDVEWSGGVAPGATIKFVISSSTATADGVDLSMIYAVDNVVAPIMTTSFSNCEAHLGTAGNIFFNNLYEQAAAEGITALASTGDTGTGGCNGNFFSGSPTTQSGVSGLASTPFNMAVGGTEFAENGLDGNYWAANNRPDQSSAIGYIPETIWNESCDPTKDPNHCGGSGAFITIAGGGGPSSCITPQIINGNFVCNQGYPKPSWQVGAGVPDDGVRDLPDVSLNAGSSHDGSLLCSEGSCQTVVSNGQAILENASVIGGTSVSAPSMAGIIALIEQKYGTFQGVVNFNFYKLAANDKLANCNSTSMTNPTHGNSCSFQDVTQGDNAVPEIPGYPAVPGYDMSSGLGSVNATNVVARWNVAPKLASRTSLLSGSITAQHGQAVPINVTVKPASGTGAPSGAVDLMTDKFGSVLGGPVTNGTFTGNVSNLPGGLYTLNARYSGDAMFKTSSSSSVAVNITPEKSLLKVTALALSGFGGVFPVTGPLIYGRPVGVDIQVAGASGMGAPTGNVTVFDGSNALITVPLAATGHAFVQVDQLPATTGMLPGKHVFTAAYSGDNSFNAATSAPSTINVIKAFSTTHAFPIPGETVTVGAPVKLVLTVAGDGVAFVSAPIVPTGTLQVFDNGKAISPQLPIVHQGAAGPGQTQAEFTTSFSKDGSHNLVVRYSGDQNYQPATTFPAAPTNTITVNPVGGVAPRITLEQSDPIVVLGQTVNYVAMVRPALAGGPMPTGTVTLVGLNGAPFNGPTALTNGNATLIESFADADTFKLALTYSGDANYAAFSSPIVTTVVNKGTPTITLKAAAATVTANTQTSLTVNVVGAPNNPIISLNPAAIPLGAVQFFDAVNGGRAQPLGSTQFLTIGNGGTPISSLPAVLPSGTNVITVQYSGNHNWLPGTSKPVTVTVK